MPTFLKQVYNSPGAAEAAAVEVAAVEAVLSGAAAAVELSRVAVVAAEPVAAVEVVAAADLGAVAAVAVAAWRWGLCLCARPEHVPVLKYPPGPPMDLGNMRELGASTFTKGSPAARTDPAETNYRPGRSRGASAIIMPIGGKSTALGISQSAGSVDARHRGRLKRSGLGRDDAFKKLIAVLAAEHDGVHAVH